MDSPNAAAATASHMTASAGEFDIDGVRAGHVDAFVRQGAVETGSGEPGQHRLVVDIAVARGAEDRRAAGADVVFHDELAAESSHGLDVLDRIEALVVVDVAGVVADADGGRVEAIVEFAQGRAVLADAGVGLGEEQDAGVLGGSDAGLEGGVEAIHLGLPGGAGLGVVGETVRWVFVGTPADQGGDAGFGGELNGLEEAFGFAGVGGDAAVGLVVDMEPGVKGGLDGGAGCCCVRAVGPEGAFVVAVVEPDVGEAGAGDAGVGAAAGEAVAGIGNGEGGEAVGHGRGVLRGLDWVNRAGVGWGVKRGGSEMGVSRAVRVFSKKLLRRGGVHFDRGREALGDDGGSGRRGDPGWWGGGGQGRAPVEGLQAVHGQCTLTAH